MYGTGLTVSNKQKLDFCVLTMRKLTLNGEEDSDNKSIDTQDTRHDNWNNGLEDELWLEDSDRADTDSGFGSSVGGTHVSEHESGNHTHTSEEHGLVWITEGCYSEGKLLV